jgi:hypothetical protein
MKKAVVLRVLIFVFLSVFAEAILAQKPKRILLEHGYLHVGNGTVIENSLVGIENEKISLVKNALTSSYSKKDWDTIIDLKGQHIYPGFVAPNSTLGLTEIDAVKATQDFHEIGIYNPHIRSQIAFNVESDVIATVRSNGVLIAQATPRGGSISGSSALMHLHGWNWEDATIASDDGIHLTWPASIQERGHESSVPKKSDHYEKAKREVYHFFKMSKAYAELEHPVTKDLRFEAMKSCFTGSKRVYIHAMDLQQLVDVLDFVKDFGIKFPVIVGGYDSYLITQQLRDAKVSVMLPRVHSLPENEEDAVDLPYRLPYLLQEGGVKYCLQNEGDMEAMNARNIPFLAGTAKAYGLTEEQAIQAVSLSSCQIMGIGDRYGSVEEGKFATLFASSGNALDMRTNNVTLTMIDGQFISLNNRQKELYKKYSAKYKGEKK